MRTYNNPNFITMYLYPKYFFEIWIEIITFYVTRGILGWANNVQSIV